MTTQYYSGPNYGGRFLGIFLAILVGAAGFAVFVRHAGTGRAGRIAALITGRAASGNLSEPAVVVTIQRLSRLETAVYSLDTVVESGRSSATPTDATGGDRSLLVVHGESVAGIDLAGLKPEDVRIDADGRGVHVRLPPAHLFSTTLNVGRTRVLARATGLAVPLDQFLDVGTRARVQDQMQQTALAEGILDAARRNGCIMVAALLDALGFERVDVT